MHCRTPMRDIKKRYENVAVIIYQRDMNKYRDQSKVKACKSGFYQFLACTSGFFQILGYGSGFFQI